jgi:hypothetical protein
VRGCSGLEGIYLSCFVEGLARKLPEELRVWATTAFFPSCPPERMMRTEVLTAPMRCAPVVLREVLPSTQFFDG